MMAADPPDPTGDQHNQGPMRICERTHDKLKAYSGSVLALQLGQDQAHKILVVLWDFL